MRGLLDRSYCCYSTVFAAVLDYVILTHELLESESCQRPDVYTLERTNSRNLWTYMTKYFLEHEVEVFVYHIIIPSPFSPIRCVLGKNSFIHFLFRSQNLS
jgi:hypothetical protein